MAACGASGAVELRASPLGDMGLFATAPAAKGAPLLTVPRAAALIIDYSAGASLPAGEWPRLSEAAAAAEPPPWDLLLGLAMLDALAGARARAPRAADCDAVCGGGVRRRGGRLLAHPSAAAPTSAAHSQSLSHLLSTIPGTAGDGGRFWQAYAEAILPPPEALALPMCLPAELLEEVRRCLVRVRRPAGHGLGSASAASRGPSPLRC